MKKAQIRERDGQWVPQAESPLAWRLAPELGTYRRTACAQSPSGSISVLTDGGATFLRGGFAIPDILEQVTEQRDMPTLEIANNHAAALYRLALLLTGDRAWSLDVTLEAIDSHGGEESFFSNWMMAWSRRVVIARALAGIRDDIAVSARRTASRRDEKIALPRRDWILDPDISLDRIESAVLGIDVFPRCALLLTLFEKVSLDDAAVLLDEDRDLVRKGRVIGLGELTRNLASMHG
jgi:hypothetical protein